MSEDREYLMGRQQVLEALRSGAALHKVFLLEDARGREVAEVRGLARERGIPLQEVKAEAMGRMAGGRRHQGVVAQAAASAYCELPDLLDLVEQSLEAGLLLALDGVEDPQNLGSLLRTADGAGCHGIIVPRRRSTGLTPAVARVAAGAQEHVPVARVSNLNQALERLAARGIWLVGADPEAPRVLWEADFRVPLVLILGNEARGLSRLVRQRCDWLVRLPMRGRVGSLNVAVSGALLLYEVLRQRGGGEK